MFRTVCAALRTAFRTASSTLVVLLPTISLSLYTWSLTSPPPGRAGRCRPWHGRPVGGRSSGAALTSTGAGTGDDVRRSGGTTYVVPVGANTSYDGFRQAAFPEAFSAQRTT